MPEITTIDKGKTTTKRRFDQREFNQAAQQIVDEHARRKRNRKDLEQDWKEIDRQVRMEPDDKFKRDQHGNLIVSRKWMPEMELPLQAQTKEVLCADARRMMFPDIGTWFIAHAEVTDRYLERADLIGAIPGDENDIPSKITQDAADKLVEGWLNFIHRQYDFGGHIDIINAEAFSYGTGIGRVAEVKKPVFMPTARGVLREEKTIPVLFPRPIQNTYLDDTSFNTMNEGYLLGPSVIFHETRQLADIILAAKKGSNDPERANGGWMPKALAKLEGDKNGNVETLEFEGDLVIPRETTRSMVVPGVIVTVVKGKKDASVIRLRVRRQKTSTYIQFPYHAENAMQTYASAPLMKGRPIHKAAVEAFNRVMQAAILNTEPPISYDRSDPFFVQTGGPVIYPRALWGVNNPQDVVQHDIGDVGALTQTYLLLLQQYSDVTGINAPRLGAQTVSHTTAFSKEAELSRGVVRTVDYVRSSLKGPLTQFLHMEYEMALRMLGSRTDTVYIEPYRGFVEITRQILPDKASFDALGSGGPAEEQAKMQRRLQAMTFAIQLEGQKVASGLPPGMNIEEIQQQVLLDGGWTDIDLFFEGSPGRGQGSSGLAPAGGGDPGATAAAVQTLAALSGGRG